jgi:hypothetical protein
MTFRRHALRVAVLAWSVTAAAEDHPRAAPKLARELLAAVRLEPDTQRERSSDPRLTAMFVDKVAECYRAESGQPLGGEDQALLLEYAPELLPHFRAALRGTSCDMAKPASDACISELSKLDCEPLAQVVRASGWDRAPSPEMEAAIGTYTTQLTERYVACQSGGAVEDEESKLRAEYLSHSSSLQIGMLLTTGQCALDMAQLQPCLDRVAAGDACEGLIAHAAASRLTRFCAQFLDCSAEPALVRTIAK